MPTANDNSGNNRRVRDGLLAKWPNANFSNVATDEALVRLADARNAASKTANTLMLLAAAAAFLYFLRIQGIAQEVSLGQYKLSNLPFGLFVLSTISLTLSSVSFIRSGDSRAFDRLLRLACDERYDCDCELRYLAFPNAHAWGEPFSQTSFAIAGGLVSKLVRLVSLTLTNLFLLALLIAPLVVGIDYLLNCRVRLDAGLADLRQVSTVFLTAANFFVLLLLLWLRLADRD